RDRSREADVEVQVEPSGKLLMKEPAERAVRGIDSADELLHVQAERHGVVPVSGPGRPGRSLTREHARYVVEVAERLDRQLLVEQDEPRLVAEELAHGDGVLAVLGEFGPVARDRRVVVEPAARVRYGQR